MKEIQNIVIYARVSHVSQDYQRQLNELRGFCKRHSYNIVGEFSEKASTLKAGPGKQYLPEREKAILKVLAGDADAILVHEFSRFGRTAADTLTQLGRLAVVSAPVLDRYHKPTEIYSSNGKLIATILAAVAEMERDYITERVRSGVAERRRKYAAAVAEGDEEEARRLFIGRRPGTVTRAVREKTATVLAQWDAGFSLNKISIGCTITRPTVRKILDTHRPGWREKKQA